MITSLLPILYATFGATPALGASPVLLEHFQEERYEALADELHRMTADSSSLEKTNKKLRKAGVDQISILVRLDAPATPAFGEISACAWKDTLSCDLTPSVEGAVIPQNTRLYCRSSGGAEVSLTLQAGVTAQVIGLERCWALNAPNVFLGEEVAKKATAKEYNTQTVPAVLKPQMHLFRTCYERARKTRPTLAGNVTIAYVIGRNGDVSSASIHRATIEIPELQECIRTRFQRMAFPPPKTGTWEGTYPFDFIP